MSNAIFLKKHLERIDYWFPQAERDELGKILCVMFHVDDSNRSDTSCLLRSVMYSQRAHFGVRVVLSQRVISKSDLPVPMNAIERHLLRMLKGNGQYYGVVPPCVSDQADSFRNIQVVLPMMQPVPNDSVDLIVSSSPYVTSYEYADLF